jgi:hypothetical protein
VEFKNFAKHVAVDLAYVLEIKGFEARIGGSDGECRLMQPDLADDEVRVAAKWSSSARVRSVSMLRRYRPGPQPH